jgi:beta-carotene hydroxylase
MGASGGQQAAEAARMERPRLPRDLYAVRPLKAAAFLAAGFAAFVGFGLLGAWLAQSPLPFALRLVLVPLCVIAAAQGAHLLGFAGHEGIHVMLHPNKWTSTLLGAFASAATSFPALGYGVAHWNHHRYTNQASDPDAAIYPQFRTFWRRFFFARGAGSRAHMRNLLLMARGRPLPLGYRLPFTLEEQRTLARINLAFLAFWFGLYVVVAYYAPSTALFAIGLPLLAVIPLSGLRGYIEHAGTGLGMFRDSRSFTHPLYTVLFFGNNYHLEHHIYPGVPCYHLPQVHRMLVAGGYFARWGSAVDATIVGPLRATTSAAQYPAADEPDSSYDPFAKAIADDAALPRIPLDRMTPDARVG